MLCGALHFFPDVDDTRGAFAHRTQAAGLSERDVQNFAIAAYPELEPGAAIRAYQRDVREAETHPTDAMADYTPSTRRR